MLECLAFKATKHRDTLRIMKEVGRLAAVEKNKLLLFLCYFLLPGAQILCF